MEFIFDKCTSIVATVLASFASSGLFIDKEKVTKVCAWNIMSFSKEKINVLMFIG